LGVGGATLGEIAGFKALRAAWSPADRYIGPLVIVESPDKQHRIRECGLQPAETLLANYSKTYDALVDEFAKKNVVYRGKRFFPGEFRTEEEK